MGGRGRQISEFEASLVYRVSSRTVTATQRNPVLKTGGGGGGGGEGEEGKKEEEEEDNDNRMTQNYLPKFAILVPGSV